ncbi:MAG: hypothetical protein KA731_03555 [Candidatus Moranbacteria bacterium]|nr:hypothetical protein [Candidatus Moranbacteria bacterium]MBP6034275.1 hypothetical protein [Candidatus Moranbacteria bacterium]MBP7695899.1 hypothetical protein [Candidatus Moranbacteria bacterium]
MTENMQAAGLEVDHVAAKPKKSKKTAAPAAGLTQLRRDQERWERADTSIPAKKSQSKRPDHPVIHEAASSPKHEDVDIVSADPYHEREVTLVVPSDPESLAVDPLEAMMGWLQNEIDAAHGQIERYRTTLNVRRMNNRISKKEAKRLSGLLDSWLAELDEIIRLGNEGEHDQEVIERLRVLQDDLDVRKHDEVPAAASQPESPRVEHGFVMEAGVEIADAEQGGSQYRIERVEGDTVSCVLLTHDTNYVGTLVFDRNDPKNVGRFSQSADRAVTEATGLEENVSVSVEAIDRSEEWQQLLAGCAKDADMLLDIMADSAAQLVELLSEEMGDGFDQASQRVCVSTYLDQVLSRVGNIALAADRDRAIDIVMQRIAKNVLQ